MATLKCDIVKLTSIGKGVLQLILNVLLAFLVTAIVLGLVGTLVLSLVARYVIANADWGFSNLQPGISVMTEADLNEGMAIAMEPYMLGVIQQMAVDFRPKDRVSLSIAGGDCTILLEGRLLARDGAPVIIVERLNGWPLYLVGGIISSGINRGFQEAWRDAPLKLVKLEVLEEQIVTEYR